eukprot:1143723-Pelagomonas_calceolata.AAC.3
MESEMYRKVASPNTKQKNRKKMHPCLQGKKPETLADRSLVKHAQPVSLLAKRPSAGYGYKVYKEKAFSREVRLPACSSKAINS